VLGWLCLLEGYPVRISRYRNDKIFIFFDLPSTNRDESSQNIEIKDFTGKILQNKGLAVHRGAPFFRARFGKIPVLLDLRGSKVRIAG
jgi:hypothetical protein